MAKHNSLVRKGEDFSSLCDEIITIVSEGRFSASLELVQSKHKVGETIVTNPLYKRYGLGQGDLVKDLAIALKIGERDLRYCVKFFEAYPSFETALQNLSPSTKSLSWRSVIKELTDEDGCRHNETRTEVVKTTKKICQSCGKILEFKHERIPDKEESNR